MGAASPGCRLGCGTSEVQTEACVPPGSAAQPSTTSRTVEVCLLEKLQDTFLSELNSWMSLQTCTEFLLLENKLI